LEREAAVQTAPEAEPEPQEHPVAPGVGRRFATVGGAAVELTASGGRFWFECGGCGRRSEQSGGFANAQDAANAHAWHCRATADLITRDRADLVRDLLLEFRQEIHQLDTRAGAGMTLSAAVLIGVVSQAPPAEPGYSLAVVGAALLTIALLMFFSVLLPATATGYHVYAKGAPDRLSGALAGTRDAYHESRLAAVARVMRVKHRRLALAIGVSGLAVMTIASAAVVSLLAQT
jgi:hypothetical protein